jgi:hypothetical protein
MLRERIEPTTQQIEDRRKVAAGAASGAEQQMVRVGWAGARMAEILMGNSCEAIRSLCLPHFPLVFRCREGYFELWGILLPNSFLSQFRPRGPAAFYPMSAHLQIKEQCPCSHQSIR